MKDLTISEVAEQTGLSKHTLRYYEKIGLLDPIRRAANGHRRYGEKDILRVEFLQRLRNTGMPIAEMQHYVALFRQGDATLRQRREVLEAHRATICQQIVALQETIDFLDGKITRYHRLEGNHTND